MSQEPTATAAPPAIKAISPWYGSKRTLAPLIVAELGEPKAYWEPFCGSMAVLFAKPPSPMETVNDLHGELINLARVLASDSYDALAKRLNRTLMADALFEEGKASIAPPGAVAESVGAVAAEHVERAFWYMVCSWMGRNGTSGTSIGNLQIAARYTSGGGSGGTRWAAVVDSVPAWHERLRRVHIRNMDAFEMLERIEDSAASAIYADPPYLIHSAKYVHDFTPGDHTRLAALLRRFNKTRVVVSYYDDPRLDELYQGWTKRDVAVTKNIANQHRRDQGGAVMAPEVLLLNGPSFCQDEAVRDGRLFQV